MARIRSVHPRLFTDEAFMSATPPARLLVIGLWCEAWDDGVFEWKPLTLKARLFAADPIDVSVLLDDLASLNFVKRFEAGGKSFGAIRNFRKFQRPRKPVTSKVLPMSLAAYVGVSGDADPDPDGNGVSHSADISDKEASASAEPTPIEQAGVRNLNGFNGPERGTRPDLSGHSNALRRVKQAEVRTFAEGSIQKVGREEGRKGDSIAQLSTQPPDARQENPEGEPSAAVRLRTGIVRAFEAANAPNVPDTARAAVWLAQGRDPALCLAVVRDVLARNPQAHSLAYFEPAIEEAHRKRAPASATKVSNEANLTKLLNLWSEGKWHPVWGAAPGEPGCEIPETFIAAWRERKAA